MTVKPLDGARDALIAFQGQVTAISAAQDAVLATRVAELEERLARLDRTASRNSGFPPSMDDQPGRTPPPARPERGKRKGSEPRSGHVHGSGGRPPCRADLCHRPWHLRLSPAFTYKIIPAIFRIMVLGAVRRMLGRKLTREHLTPRLQGG